MHRWRFMRRSYRALMVAVLWGGMALPARSQPRPLEFHVTFDAKVQATPFTGRVYVMLNQGLGEPRRGPNWFNPGPMFAVDVVSVAPNTPIVIGAQAVAFPTPLPQLKPGSYAVQAVLDRNLGYRDFSNAPGNGYSKNARFELHPQMTGPVKLHIDQIVAERPFVETERVKLFEIESTLLSRFHGRPVKLRAGIILPTSYAQEPDRRYPIIYEVPGFSGNHYAAQFLVRREPTKVDGVDMIYVVLDPDCPLGHHVFADSENNGPCGQALIQELIPALEARFRAIGKPGARFVTGHSSGGWSSLWLQITYPDVFGGVWSTAPDPVDFRDFQRINLYRPGENMFTDAEGKPRPIARVGGQPRIFYKAFSDMEIVMGHGGQLGSFEAVFSPRGSDGKPLALWNRQTGAIEATVAKAWEKYDIRLVLERQWPQLAPKLKGKLHVYMGGEDTFYLEGAVALLKASLAKLGSDAVVEIVPGKDHGSLMDREMRLRIAREMANTFRRNFPST